MEQFELVTLKNGIMSLRSVTEPRETFHPGIGPVKEATLLHIDQARLKERCKPGKQFTIWDIGLGAGANALTAIRALNGIESQITLQSFDRTTAPLEFALQNSRELDYPLGFEPQIRELIYCGSVQISPNLFWKLNLGNFCELVQSTSIDAPDSIFFDPYSPRHNSEMWTVSFFKNLFLKLDPKRPCLLTNYTRSTSIRVTLLLAGFYVGIGTSIHEKEETTIATNVLSELERPLGPDWLKRVRVSHTASPLRFVGDQAGPISEQDFESILCHPQF